MAPHSLSSLLALFEFILAFRSRLLNGGFFDDIVAERQNVHAALLESVKRFRGCVDDRFSLQIERRIQEDRHPARLSECLD
jgi:hypothetical protein